jgi:N-acetylneuraminic acid mutarotase
VEAYDPATDSWTTEPEMPMARGGFTSAALDSAIHVTGGEAFDPAATFATHDAFDSAGRRWRTLPAMPTARHGLDSVAVDGRWYVIGGGTGAGARTFFTLTDAVEIFTPLAR